MKKCKVCEVSKCESEFYASKRHKDRLYSNCKSCEKERKRRFNADRREEQGKYWKNWRVQNKDKVQKYRLKHLYSLEPTDVDKMLEAQAGLCAICNCEYAQCIDHDHSSGRIRGMLCQKCNKGLGCFRDEIKFLRAAIEYLETLD